MSNSINFWNEIKHCDEIFDYWKQQRMETLDLLIKDTRIFINRLWNYNSPINIDKECLWMLGLDLHPKHNLNNMSSTTRKNHKCSSCLSLSRISQDKNLSDGSSFTFQLEVGDKINRSFIIVSKDIFNLFISITDITHNYLNRLINGSINNYSICEPNITNLSNVIFIGSDEFTNQILVTWYINKILNKFNLFTAEKIYTAFVCSNKGNLITDKPDIGSISSLLSNYQLQAKDQKLEIPFVNYSNSNSVDKISDTQSRDYTKDVIIMILKQLFATLHILQQYDFTYGNPSINSIQFYNHSTDVIYDGVTIKSPFTLKITNIKQSGITIIEDTRLLRLYVRSELAENMINKNLFKPLIKIINDAGDIIEQNINTQLNQKSIRFSPTSATERSEVVLSQVPHKGAVYKLNIENGYFKQNLLYLYYRNMGIPMFSSSLNGYIFMIILMLNPIVYKEMKKSEIWESLWLKSEVELVNKDIDLLHNSPRGFPVPDLGPKPRDDISDIKDTNLFVDYILPILRKYHLRCNAISHIWNIIKTLYK